MRHFCCCRGVLIILTVAVFLCHVRPVTVNGAETASVRNTSSPEEVLVEGLTECRESIDLSAYAIPVTELGALLARVTQAHPELFHVDGRLSYTYDADGYVHAVIPTYTLTGEALAAARRLYSETVAEFCRTVPDTWSEADRVLYIHDRLAASYVYDETDSKNYDAYRLFRDGRGVCQAYAMAFLALARALGLEADVVTSDAMDHAWNHVRVDGAWYHVDVTRDLLPASADGRIGLSPVGHSRLLLSDEAAAALGYRAYTCADGHRCDDQRFETDGARGILSHLSTAAVRPGDVWCIPAEDGSLTAFVWGNASVEGTSALRPVIYAAGDLDGDGAVTVADLLILRQWMEADDGARPPEAAVEWLREELVAEG